LVLRLIWTVAELLISATLYWLPVKGPPLINGGRR
jgi:hypothetical protein